MITADPQRIAEMTAAGHWGDLTLHQLLRTHAAERGVQLAVKDPPNRAQLTGDPPLALSWHQLEQACTDLALQLTDHGITAGDRVIVQLPNVVELVVVYYALARLGAIVSPVPVQYGAHELNLVCGALAAGHMITMAQAGSSALAEAAAEALPAVALLVFGRDLQLRPDAVAHGSAGVEPDANRIVSICWTSGTTGTPKGVPRSHNTWLAAARRTMAAGDYRSDDVLLNPFPLVNMAALAGFLFPSALLGCALILHHPLDPAVFLGQLQDEGVSFTIAPPALLNQLAKSPDRWRQYDFSRLRRVGSGSAPLAPWMIETFSAEFGVEVVNFYGSNEGICLFATPESAPEAAVRAAMFPIPDPGAGIETRVADTQTMQTLTAQGDIGELLIRGATVFDGYLDHDGDDVFTGDGFFRTGDLVEICGAQGDFYRIAGRCKDIINRGGMKISPAELDVALEQHPDLSEAAVCAMADERLGEIVCACVVPAPGCYTPSLEALAEFLLALGFAKFKLPQHLVVMDSLPRNALGKVQRFALQKQVETATKKG